MWPFSVRTSNQATQCRQASSRLHLERLEDRTVPSFGIGGLTVTDFGSSEWIKATALQEDGKILAAGVVAGDGQDFAVARYNSDGTLDGSFGKGGFTRIDLARDSDFATGLAVQSDGKIVVSGWADVASRGNPWIWQRHFAVVRLGTDGALDKSFGDRGQVITAFDTGNATAEAMALQPDGKIVLAGHLSGNFALARYNADGSLDTTFDGDGLLVVTPAEGPSSAAAVTLQGDGKIVAAGSVWNGTDSDFALARFDADGSLDTSFDGDGWVTTSFSAEDVPDGARAVMVDDATGKIVAGGQVDGYFALARYLSDGSLDRTFDADGMVTTAIGSSPSISREDGWSVINTLALDADGKIVAGGHTQLATWTDEWALARYLDDGSLDAAFSDDGIATLDVPGGGPIQALALQSDGKIVAGGSSYNGSDNDFTLARYNADGTLDDQPEPASPSLPPPA